MQLWQNSYYPCYSSLVARAFNLEIIVIELETKKIFQNHANKPLKKVPEKKVLGKNVTAKIQNWTPYFFGLYHITKQRLKFYYDNDNQYCRTYHFEQFNIIYKSVEQLVQKLWQF